MTGEQKPPRWQPGEFLVDRDQVGRTVPCAACRAPMVWIETKTGRRMPLSARTAREIPCPACQGRQGAPCPTCRSARVVYALTAHWADCPEAERFRRRRVERPRPGE